MNFLSRCILGCLAAFCILTTAFAQQTPGRKREPFNDGWRFQLGNAANVTQDGNYGLAVIFSKSGKADSTVIAPKFNDANWRSVQLPHDWAVELPFVNKDNENLKDHGYRPVGGLFPQNSVGWYRKKFYVAKADSGKRFSITFDGIFRDSKVWINGFYLGGNESGYIGFTRDITDFVNFNAPNIIVVRADATQAEGWFYEGAGIYRNVWLNTYNNVNIADDVFVHTRVNNNAAVITIEANLQNQGLHPASCRFYAEVTDRNGKIIGKTKPQQIDITQAGNQFVKQQITLKNPELWSVEQPYLYHIKPVVIVGDKQADSRDIRFGVRTIQIKADGVFLNGKHVKLKGTNNHQDHAGVGAALPDYLQYYRIGLLKQMGSNAYRTSHHAPTPELLDACDSLGMLVLDEQRLLNSSPEYMGQFERLLKRDRNHPSVFLWSIGNEEGYAQANSFGKRIAQSLLAKQILLDPTRTSTYAADLANVFTGVNEVIPVRGFNYRQFAVADYHRDHPAQPIIGTEMGSTLTTRGVYVKDTIAGYLPDEDITAPWWASKAEEWWPLAANNKYWLGGFIWTGFDYRGEPTPFKWPNVNSHFGMMDVCGFPKNLYYYYQSCWKDDDVLHLSPHWNWKGKEGQKINVWVNSNADDVELFLNGNSLGKKVMPRNSHLEWDVAYKPGILKAIGTRKGKSFISEVKTTGKPYQIKLSPSKNVLLADGRDAVVVNISVTDKNGLEVPDASNLIEFVCEGGATIIGVGNGDPSSHEADKMDSNWQRHLFNGYCQLILKAGNNPQKVMLRAVSKTLQSAEVSLLIK